MGRNLNFIVYNTVTFLWKGFAVDSIEVTSFTEVEVDNPDSIDFRLCKVYGDLYVVPKGRMSIWSSSFSCRTCNLS